MQNSKFQIYHIERESYMYEVLNVNYLQFFLKMSVTLRNESNDGN